MNPQPQPIYYAHGKDFFRKHIFFFLRLYEELTEYFMIEPYVSFLKKPNDAIFILIKVHFGGLRAPYLQTPKTVFNNSEPNAVKFGIEFVCTQEIIMGYMSLENYSKKGSWGNPLTNFFFLKIYEELAKYFMIESYVSFLKKANDAIFILMKVHFWGLWAQYLQTPKTAFKNSEPIAMKFNIEIV